MAAKFSAETRAAQKYLDGLVRSLRWILDHAESMSNDDLATDLADIYTELLLIRDDLNTRGDRYRLRRSTVRIRE